MSLFEARWICLVSCLFLDASAGTGYAFGVYSPQLKTALDYTQSELDLVAFMGNLGTYTCFVGGLIFDRYGPKAAGAFGVSLSLLGYALLWAGASKHIPHTPFLIGLYQFIWSYGSSAVDITAVSVTIRNFPLNCGSMVGLLKSFYGIASALVTRFYTTWYQPHAIQFLLFLTAFVTILGGVTLIPVDVVPKKSTYPLSKLGMRRIHFGFAVVVVLCIYLGVVGILTGEKVISDGPALAYIMIFLVLLPSLMIYPFSFWVDTAPKGSEMEAFLAEQATVDGSRIINDDGSNVTEEEVVPPEDAVHVHGDTVMQAVLSIDFWCIMVIGASWTGAGLMLINNIGQIVPALGGNTESKSYVTVISVANCFGRLIAGFASDAYSEHLSRPMFLVVFLGFLLMGMLVLAFSNLGWLYLGCLGAAAAYGAYWALVPTLVKDRFGTRALGTIMSILSIASAAGSYLLAKTLFASVYQAHTLPHSTACVGHKCFQLTCLICALLCGASIIVALVLWYRLRGLYAVHDAKSAARDIIYKAPNRTASGTELAI